VNVIQNILQSNSKIIFVIPVAKINGVHYTSLKLHTPRLEASNDTKPSLSSQNDLDHHTLSNSMARVLLEPGLIYIAFKKGYGWRHPFVIEEGVNMA